jgi:uncharacterized membrane protein
MGDFMTTVVGVFERYEEADGALRDLNELGFGKEEISVVAPEEKVRGKFSTENQTSETTAKTGAIFGGLAGLLIGVGTVVAPGVGTLLTAGALATTLGTTVAGAGIGAAAGSIRGSLREMKVPDAEAKILEEGIHKGGILVAVITPEENLQRVKDIMKKWNTNVLEIRRNLWERGEGELYREITKTQEDQREESDKQQD